MPQAPRRIRPGIWPYPAIRFLEDLQLRERAQRLTLGLVGRMRIWRVEQSLTREELAELTGVPVTAIKRVERTGEISLERFVRLAMQLGLEDDLCRLFEYTRHRVPAVVLAARGRKRKHGRRAVRARAVRREFPTRRDRA